jgi:predicted HNH restriction endonuclease
MEEEDAEVKVITVTTQLVEKEEAEVKVVVVATQLVEEDAELMEADAVVVVEMEACTEGKKRRCGSMALRRNAEVIQERMSEGQ